MIAAVNNNNIPAYVAAHMEYPWVKEYRNNVTRKFPIADNFEDIEYGDEGEVFEREGKRMGVIDHWDDFNFQVFIKKECGLVVGMNPIWCVKRG